MEYRSRLSLRFTIYIVTCGYDRIMQLVRTFDPIMDASGRVLMYLATPDDALAAEFD